MATEKSKHKEKKSTAHKKGVFEFCPVCRINHDSGRRHNYFSSHTKSLSALFSRFQNKLSHLRSSLQTPKLSRFQDGSPTPIWCVFCEHDIDQHRSAFASENAIRHLASEIHLKNVKQFIWKYGGGMSKVDSFRFTEAELEKWEKKCAVLKTADASDADKYDGSTQGHSTKMRIARHLSQMVPELQLLALLLCVPVPHRFLGPCIAIQTPRSQQA